MNRLRWPTVLLFGLLTLIAEGEARPSRAQSGSGRVVRPSSLPVALDDLPAGVRESVRRVLRQPTITAAAPTEEFVGRKELYDWLLDHPDRAALAWRRLGVGCLEVQPLGLGHFSSRDGQGGEVRWQTVWSGPEGRVWYAEGLARTAALLPSVHVRAVAVLRCDSRPGEGDRTVIRHQVELYLQTDSKAAALLARLMGSTAPRLAQEGASQLLIFFSGLTHYLHQHPERATQLLAPAAP